MESSNLYSAAWDEIKQVSELGTVASYARGNRQGDIPAGSTIIDGLLLVPLNSIPTAQHRP